MAPGPRHDILRTVLQVGLIGLLAVGCLWTLRPFLGALIWSATITVATWPLLVRVQALAGGRRSVAAAVMTLLMLAVFVAPTWLAIDTLLEAGVRGVDYVKSFEGKGLAPPPDWLQGVPWFGERLAARWRSLAEGGVEGIVALVGPHVRAAGAWIIGATGSLAMVFVNLGLTVVISAILYVSGERAAGGVVLFARRLGGDRGEHSVRLAAQAVRSVALGVVVTALVQSLLGALGLWVSGVPHPGLLLAVMLVLGVAQLGPFLVLLPAVAWLYWNGSVGWAAALLVWSIPVGMLDNVLRPVLIRKGVDLPLLLIFVGVIGGLIAFGVLGLFIGPVLLAVTYRLLEAWVSEGEPGRGT